MDLHESAATRFRDVARIAEKSVFLHDMTVMTWVSSSSGATWSTSAREHHKPISGMGNMMTAMLRSAIASR